MVRIGLISDTHGLLRPEALEFLRGSRHILHAGDIGRPDILQALAKIAPVTAVRGNIDGAWADAVPQTERVQFGKASIYMIHNIAELDIEPKAAGVQVVVSGHSHKPLIEDREGVLYVNPGSAGPRRFSLPVAAGELCIEGPGINPRIVLLK